MENLTADKIRTMNFDNDDGFSLAVHNRSNEANVEENSFIRVFYRKFQDQATVFLGVDVGDPYAQ